MVNQLHNPALIFLILSGLMLVLEFLVLNPNYRTAVRLIGMVSSVVLMSLETIQALTVLVNNEQNHTNHSNFDCWALALSGLAIFTFFLIKAIRSWVTNISYG